MTDHEPTPEGELLERARKLKGLSQRNAAKMAGISDGRWRQIVNGGYYAAADNWVSTVGPDDTLARMARSVGVTADQLRAAGRGDAADLLLTVKGMELESDWQNVGNARDRLLAIREQIDWVIRDLSLSDQPESEA
jgi:transcriptional regulator with XRE-family HTH domain